MSRQPSPALGPVASLVAQISKKADRTVFFSHLTTVKDCVLQLPSAYRPRLQAIFFELADRAEKYGRVDKTLQTLRHHNNNNEFPPQIQAIHEPKFQFCKEFIESATTKEAHDDYSRKLHSAWTTFRSSSMAAVMEAKKEELCLLEGGLQMGAYKHKIIEVVDEIYGLQSTLHNVTGVDNDGNIVMDTVQEGDVEGEIPRRTASSSRARSMGTLPGDQGQPWTKADRDVAAWDGPLLAARVIDIVRNRDIAACANMLKKLSIKKSASNVSEEFAENLRKRNLSLDEQVRAAVQSALASKSSTPDHEFGPEERGRTNMFTHRTKPAKKQGPSPEKRGRTAGGEEPPAKKQRKETSFVDAQHRDYEEAAPERACSKGEGQKIVLPSTFRWNEIDTYPEGITLIPFQEAVELVRSRIPVEELVRKAWRNVHKLEGVTLPADVEEAISLGLKYLLYTEKSFAIVRTAWNNWVNSLKWRIYFETVGRADEPYDPDYALQKDTVECPYVMPQHVEMGIREGLGELLRQINMPAKTPIIPKEDQWIIEKLQGHLRQHKLLVTASDKNLGSVVMSVDWYHKNCRNFLLHNPTVFEKIPVWVAESLNTETWIDIDAIAEMEIIGEDVVPLHSEASPYKFTKQEVEWLRSSKELVNNFPEFSGLPKIHKKPFAFRPIVPCHSVVSGPPAKMLSKMLKPAIKATWSIIRNSGEVASKLSSIKLDPTKKVYLLSADVVSCYTNIPLEKLPEVCERALYKYPNHKERLLSDMRLSKKLCRIANDRLVFSYTNELGIKEYYLQRKGLAMGVACSPDLANLFLAEHETHMSEQADVLYYGRFIDDMLLVLYANSLEDALKFAKRVLPPPEGMQFKWEGSPNRIVFLDLEIFVNAGEDIINFRPYRKPLNHFERIHWSSKHPSWMKRGAFIGELSRLATLSSREQFNVAAVADLKRIYYSRGYPDRVINSWLSKNVAMRWETKNKKKEEKEGMTNPLHILKTELNPVWESVDITKVFTVMQDKILESPEEIPECVSSKTGFLLSRRRTDNLGDWFNRWNSSLKQALRGEAGDTNPAYASLTPSIIDQPMEDVMSPYDIE